MAKQEKKPTRLLRFPEVISRTGLGRSWIDIIEARGEFPSRIRLSFKCVAWVESEIDSWIEAQIATARGEQKAS